MYHFGMTWDLTFFACPLRFGLVYCVVACERVKMEENVLEPCVEEWEADGAGLKDGCALQRQINF